MRSIRLSIVTTAAVLATAFTAAVPAQAAPVVAPPGAPTNVMSMPLGPSGGLSLLWTAPGSTGGAAITGYTVDIAPGSLTYNSAGTFYSVPSTDLTPGTTYTVTVQASNSAGTGAASAPLVIEYYTAPSPPTAVSAAADDGQVTVSWSAPLSDGGKAIIGYTATASDGSFSFSAPPSCSTTTEMTCTITGLTNGTTYSVSVSASNGLIGFPFIGVSVTPTAPFDPCVLDPQSSPSCPGYVPPVTVPGTPGDVAAAASDRVVTVSWSAPTSDGGAAITGYRVSTFPSGKTCSTTGALSCAISGLTNGTSYTFTVVAINSVGSGVGGSVSTTPKTIPGAPTNASATPGDRQVTVSWSAPDSDGGSAVTGYTVTAFPGGHSCSTTGALTCTVTGLTNGTAYSFLVAANNSEGSGDAAQADATPYTVPGAPSGVSATAGAASATVSWNAAVGNGAAISGYTVTAAPGGKTCTTIGALSCTVTGLTNGTSYTFTVTASNASGDGPASAASAPATPRTTPDAPTAVSAVAGDGSATVSWSAPSFDGGSSITGYTVTAAPGGATCTATALETSCTVEGLDNLMFYSFTVTATNAAGTSADSDASERVVPHSDEFQVWLPNLTVAHDGDTQVWIFGAVGVQSLAVRIGNETFDASPDDYGVAIVDYNAAEMTQWVRTGTIRVIAKALRVDEDGSKVKLRATAMLYSPSVTLGKRWRAGKQVTVRARSAAPGSSLSFQIDGFEVCATDASERGRATCSFDAPDEGDYTLEAYVLHNGEEPQLIATKDFSILPSGRRAD